MKFRSITFTLLICMLCSFPLDAQMPFTVPFYQANHLILVEAVADGRAGLFILDTGADDIILNEKYFVAQKTGEEIFEDINGHKFHLPTGWVNLELGALSRKNEQAFFIDLQALEKVLGKQLFGKIGTRFFRKTVLEIDYAAQQLMIYPPGWEKQRTTDLPHPPGVWTTDMKMKGHIPYIQRRVNGKRIRLGLDTGAEVNVLDERGKDRLDCDLLQAQQVTVCAVGDAPVVAEMRQLVHFKLGLIAYAPMGTLIIPTLTLNHRLPGSRLDGILGYPFLSQHRIAFNFDEMTITFRQLQRGAKRISFMARHEE